MRVVSHTLVQRHCVYSSKFANLIYEKLDLVDLICISCKLMSKDEHYFRCVKCIFVSCVADWQFNFFFIVHFSVGLLAFVLDLYMSIHARYLCSREISPLPYMLQFFHLIFHLSLNLFYFLALDIENL